MACKICCLCATDISTRNGVTTITVPDGTITGLCNCQEICVEISTDFPTVSKGNRIEITDGATTLKVACKNQYWRPCQLICNSKIVMEYRCDPALLVFKYGIKGGCC